MRDFFRTTDLPLSSFLFTQKVDFHGLEPKDGRSYWFLFSPLKRCETLANEFASGRAEVSARDFADAMRRSKDLVFQRERSQAVSL